MSVASHRPSGRSRVDELAGRVAALEEQLRKGFEHALEDHTNVDLQGAKTADALVRKARAIWGGGAAGGGLLSLLTMRNTVPQTYPGGYTDAPVDFNVTDTETFGAGLAYEAGNGLIAITVDGWYQAVCNLSVIVVGSVSGQRGHVRLALRRFSGLTIGSNSTFVDDEDSWLGAASRPFRVSGGYDEVRIRVSHDVLDGGVPMDLADQENGDTFLSVYRIA